MKYLFILTFILVVLLSFKFQDTYTVDPLIVEMKQDLIKHNRIALEKKKSLPKQDIFDVYDNTWEGFKSLAYKIAKEEGVPPSVVIAQAALESGRGTSYFARVRNNYFGMNAIDRNPNKATQYSTPEASIRSYISLIKNEPRYVVAWLNRNDPVRMIKEIKQAGYASDPRYVAKVMSMSEFDEYINK